MVSRESEATAPLWRAAQVFRLLSCVYALGFQIAINGDLLRPGLTRALFAVLIGFSAVAAVAYLRGVRHRSAWVLAEIVVVVGLMLSTDAVASRQWTLDNQSWPTTLWASNATVSAALQFGPVGGMVTAAVVTATSAFVKGYLSLNLGRNATVVIELALGLAVGMAAVTARRVHDELQRATRLAAATEERERLSRHVHDGVIQVLALVARRGREIGGPAAELAELAGEQERALRRLVSSSELTATPGSTDLRSLLSRREGDRVSLSLPGTAVPLPGDVAAELDAAIGNVLDNVRQHAGPDARAFVLLEDLADTVLVSVRDDGPGIADGRLAQAVRQGRLGISQAIVGRLEALGGSARLHTEIGEGTEWELSVPRRAGRDD
ncbi:ATP-binding protein [Mycobacterium sp. M1]|uniref:ATP-binding protein n=1 Tax=Mycolicibacter acidiphilus TaxID=2835306 RepID=A0ABS5RP80_9MYCO|nr:ATP-binding protein [Mycolicibacter acidiphilus]MBS9536095.1 ATP-binding protein [Mycolicibacter acidiphilus]